MRANRYLFNERFSVLTGIILIVLATVSSFGQVQDETIKISTELVTVNFAKPKDEISKTKIFDGQNEVTGANFIYPSYENKLQLLVVLDFEPCQSKKECRSLSKLGANLRENFRKLRNNEKPQFIVNSESLDMDDIKKLLDFNVPEAKETGSFDEALFQVEKTSFDNKNQRQSLLILTNKIRDLREMNLEERFANYSGFVDLITTKIKSDGSWIGWNNLGLPGISMQDNGNDGYVYDLQFGEFVETCNSLTAVSFYRDDETAKKVTIKTYSKIWGEQSRSRLYLTPQLLQKKLLENYYDADILTIGKSIEKIPTENLLPVIKNNLVNDSVLEQKVKNSQQWLKTKYGFSEGFPFVVFKFNKGYAGIQEFKSIAFSTEIVEKLSEEELAAITAHELAHVILKNEPESETLEEKCDFIGYLILPAQLRPFLFSAIVKMSADSDQNHSALRHLRLKENLAAFAQKRQGK